ncbi:unnamed protein product [Penicillium nalgiovense]|nr:unnamed protein product [Penicillium nalgiovense]
MHSSAISVIFHSQLLSPQGTESPNPKTRYEPEVPIHPDKPQIRLSSDIRTRKAPLHPYYMTLSSSIWLTTMPAMNSIFLNPDIPCNLVSAWKNPAFAIINPLMKQGNIPHLLNGVSARQPRVASLWLGAAIMGTSSVSLKQCEQGMMMPSLQAEA